MFIVNNKRTFFLPVIKNVILHFVFKLLTLNMSLSTLYFSYKKEELKKHLFTKFSFFSLFFKNLSLHLPSWSKTLVLFGALRKVASSEESLSNKLWKTFQVTSAPPTLILLNNWLNWRVITRIFYDF